MKRYAGGNHLKGSRLPLSILLLIVLSMGLAGCQVGPIDFSNGTPGPTQPPPGPQATTTPAMRPITGLVTDVDTGKPIAGAEVSASGVLTGTSESGLFYFEDVPQGTKISISAEGYRAFEIEAGVAQELPPVQLKADMLSGVVTDAKTGKPIADVLVKLTYPIAAPITATTPITPEVGPTATLTSTDSMRPGGLSAPLLATKAPTSSVKKGTPTTEAAPTSTAIPKTPIARYKPPVPTGEGFVAMYTDANGQYLFKGALPGSTISFKMPGYKLEKVAVDGPKADVALEQFQAKALYMTANWAASPDLYEELVEFAQTSMFNAVVLNVQTDESEWVFETKNKDALDAKNVDLMLPNIADVVKDLQSKGFYVIARIATFQQKTMAIARPDLAVLSSATDKPWRGGYTGQHAWLDASNPKTQDHLVDMTKEIVELGFDEIQYDYVRFPSDPAPNERGKTVFSTMPLTDTGKVEALRTFLTKAQAVIDPSDAFMSIDVFGYVLWPNQDGTPILGVIGQVLPDLIGYADYISPMIYPSHFSPGEQGCSVPAKCAYKLVKQSGVYAKPLFEGGRSKYRPWLQDFDWGETDYTSRGTTKVQEQIDACNETDCWGWMMWDPRNEYEPRAVFRDK